MGKDQSTRKDCLIDLVVVAFVVITMGMLIAQLGLNVVDALAAENVATLTPAATVTPSGPTTPTPTFDIGSIEIKGA